MMGYGFGAFGGMGLGMLVGAVVWVGLIVLAVWAITALIGTRGKTREDAPLDMLKKRYARGELSEAEFEQARRRLVA
jgi:putative membrane protein